MLDLSKVLILKIKSNFDNGSDQEPTSRDELGRPKRCPHPRLEKLILDRHGVSTGARYIYVLPKILKRVSNYCTEED